MPDRRLSSRRSRYVGGDGWLESETVETSDVKDGGGSHGSDDASEATDGGGLDGTGYVLDRRLSSRRSRYVGRGLESGTVETSDVRDGGGLHGSDGTSEATDGGGTLGCESVLGRRGSSEWESIVSVGAVSVFQ